MNDIDKFKRRIQIEKSGDNAKIAVVAVLLLSVAAFTVMGKQNVKPIIWYWAAGMSLLLIGCAIQDLLTRRKIRKEGF